MLQTGYERTLAPLPSSFHTTAAWAVMHASAFKDVHHEVLSSLLQTGYENTGTSVSMFAARISWTWDFRGPCKAIDTGAVTTCPAGARACLSPEFAWPQASPATSGLLEQVSGTAYRAQLLWQLKLPDISSRTPR